MKKVTLIRTGMLPTNTYVLFDDESKECVVVDPACDSTKVVTYIVDMGLDLSAIVLTHGHFDHCGGVNTLLRHKSVKVYGSSLDADLAANASKNRWKARAEDCIITDYVDRIGDFSVGCFEFKVLETPGHTEGSVCYFVDDLMFSGDTLFDGCVGRTDLPGGDQRKMLESLKKLSKLTFDYTVLPGHESTTTFLEQKRDNPYLRLEAFDYD